MSPSLMVHWPGDLEARVGRGSEARLAGDLHRNAHAAGLPTGAGPRKEAWRTTEVDLFLPYSWMFPQNEIMGLLVAGGCILISAKFCAMCHCLASQRPGQRSTARHC